MHARRFAQLGLVHALSVCLHSETNCQLAFTVSFSLHCALAMTVVSVSPLSILNLNLQIFLLYFSDVFLLLILYLTRVMLYMPKHVLFTNFLFTLFLISIQFCVFLGSLINACHFQCTAAGYIAVYQSKLSSEMLFV